MTEQKAAGEKARAYDAAEFLESDEDVVAYLNAALEDGDPSLVSAAFGDVTRPEAWANREDASWASDLRRNPRPNNDKPPANALAKGAQLDSRVRPCSAGLEHLLDLLSNFTQYIE